MFSGETAIWLTCILFTLTYIGLALGKVPGLHMDRAGIALVGAILMLVTGMVSFEQALSPDSIDYKTLALLFGMMVVIGFLRLSGCFVRMAAWTLRRIHAPLGLLAVTIILSGMLSAFLINDIVCLTLTPLVLHLARRLRFDPVPHLIALATAANIGSTGTVTGNPQNIYIGSHSSIPYLRFAVRLLPVAALGLVVNFLVVAFVYRRSLFALKSQAAGVSVPTAQDPNGEEPTGRRAHRWLQCKSVAVTLTVLTLALGIVWLQFVRY